MTHSKERRFPFKLKKMGRETTKQTLNKKKKTEYDLVLLLGHFEKKNSCTF